MISVVRGCRAKLKLEATRLCEKTNQKKGAGKEGCVCVHVCVCVFQECGSLVHACALALSRDCRQPQTVFGGTPIVQPSLSTDVWPNVIIAFQAALPSETHI